MVGNSHLKTPSANTELATRVKEKVKAYYKAYRRNNNFDFKVKSKLFQQAMRQAKHQHNSKLLDNAKPEPTKYWKIVNDEKVRKGRRKVKLRSGCDMKKLIERIHHVFHDFYDATSTVKAKQGSGTFQATAQKRKIEDTRCIFCSSWHKTSISQRYSTITPRKDTMQYNCLKRNHDSSNCRFQQATSKETPPKRFKTNMSHEASTSDTCEFQPLATSTQNSTDSDNERIRLHVNMDFDPRYPFLVERTDPIGSKDMADYVAQLSNRGKLRQLEHLILEEAITKHWIREMQRGSQVISDINKKLIRYATRMGNLKTLLKGRVGHCMPELEEAPQSELLKDHVNKSTQTIGIEEIENQPPIEENEIINLSEDEENIEVIDLTVEEAVEVYF
ncbi:hypothetical protein V9T40_003341 [Parthenolecanium corni]|uniref:Uncharacterized protein n=1 Tax=Parthenolecanium corni TaxID=536013 RepID=A0AAN9TSZ7_9HEMI